MRLRQGIYRLEVIGTSRRYIVDRLLAPILTRFAWRYNRSIDRAWAVVRPKRPRVLLHKYIAKLAGYRWVEVCFANNNPFDCRISNLQPYRRDEEGARRKVFRNKQVRFKGVYFKKSTRKFGAAIRHRGKLIHLGYFTDPNQAALAYRRAYMDKHPNLPPP